MKAADAIVSALQSTEFILTTYLSDLSDADLLVRPVPAANHIAWQMGHLINAECSLGAKIPNVSYPTMPASFLELEKPGASSNPDTKGYLSKQQYLELFRAVRYATVSAVKDLLDSDLDRPTTGPMAKYAPTLAAILLMISNHTLMHAGQYVVVRRLLGKPILI